MTTVSMEPKAADALFSLDILTVEPADVYHSNAGRYLSSHLLLDFMTCPLLYHKKVSGQKTDIYISIEHFLEYNNRYWDVPIGFMKI